MLASRHALVGHLWYMCAVGRHTTVAAIDMSSALMQLAVQCPGDKVRFGIFLRMLRDLLFRLINLDKRALDDMWQTIFSC